MLNDNRDKKSVAGKKNAGYDTDMGKSEGFKEDHTGGQEEKGMEKARKTQRQTFGKETTTSSLIGGGASKFGPTENFGGEKTCCTVEDR